MKIFLVGYPVVETDPVARGYYTFADGIERALLDDDTYEIVDEAAGAEVALHLCPPHLFEPVEGLRNVCFTMWEAPAMPDNYPEILGKADALIVPSKFCRETFERAGLRNVHVAQLAPDAVFGKQDATRRAIRGPGSPRLRFLYVGSMSPRKGAHLLAPAWRLAFEGRIADADQVQLYMKGIGADPSRRSLQTPYGDERVVVDTRDISREELARLYGSADVFLFPSFGEGFGLPAIEAMAAGCLACSTDAGGLSEFVSEFTSVLVRRHVRMEVTYGVRYVDYVPSAESLALAIRQAFEHWGSSQAEAIRKNGTSRARSFTWQKTIDAVGKVLQGVPNENLIQTA